MVAVRVAGVDASADAALGRPHDMADETRDRYPADQQFGKAAAEDQEKVDRGEVDTSDDTADKAPRAGNKA